VDGVFGGPDIPVCPTVARNAVHSRCLPWIDGARMRKLASRG
jgi:hypothetical protein